MRQQVVCAEGNNANEAESILNKRLRELGPNFQTLSVQGSGVSVRGKPGVLLVALVQLTAENNIGYWPLSNLGLTSEELGRLRELLGTRVANVHDLTVICGIRKTLNGGNKPLFRAVTRALGKHGLCMTDK